VIAEDRTLCFIDAETTHLDRDVRRGWEVALIVREPFADEVEFCWQIDAADLDLDNASPTSLEIGRFDERHGIGDVYPEKDVAVVVHSLTKRKAAFVGAIVSFDEHTMFRMLQRHGLIHGGEPEWHHRVTDVEAMARAVLGWPAARGSLGDLARALGLQVDDGQRHTAIGDARLARDVYDHIRSRTWVAAPAEVAA
jgi:hypothetical protein